MYVVYGLEDPRDNAIFYVGMTADLYERFIQHLRCVSNNEDKNERIHQLKSLGLLPIPRTFQKVNTVKHAREREQYWITHYAMLGIPLTNELRSGAARRIREAIEEYVPVLSTTPQANGIVLTEREKRILKKYREGTSINAIIASEYSDGNGKPLTGGRLFTEKAKEIQALIARFLPQVEEA